MWSENKYRDAVEKFLLGVLPALSCPPVVDGEGEVVPGGREPVPAPPGRAGAEAPGRHGAPPGQLGEHHRAAVVRPVCNLKIYLVLLIPH